MTSRALLPRDPAASARALLPIAILILGAGVREVRLLVLVAAVAGTVVGIRRQAPVRWAWAATLPVALSLSWGLIVPPAADPLGGDCASPFSPPALWRLGEAILVLGAIVVLARTLHAPAASVWWRRPSRTVVRLSVAAFIVFGPLGLLLGPTLARPFFGSFGLDLSDPPALVPALIFAVSNGVMEETAYRGALMGWTARVVGLAPALVLQSVVFGLAHSGPDFVGSPWPVIAALAAGGFIAGLITIRTRSLLLPIAVHVALDLPLYVYLACRTA